MYQNDNQTHNQNYSAFTLLEVLLTIALISIVSVISVSSYQGLQTGNDLQTGINAVVKGMRSAQLNSQAVVGDSSWGVKINSQSVVIFKGTSYATRDTVEDINLPISTSIAVGGTTEFVFTKLSGIVQTPGTLSLTVYGRTNQVTVNAKGTVTY